MSRTGIQHGTDFLFLSAGVLVGLLVVLTVLLARPARAATCGANGSGWEGDPSQSVSHYGAKIGSLLVTTPTPSCPIVRSTTVWNTQYDYVEVGWYIDSSGFLAVCDTYASPHFLQTARVSGGVDCAHPSAAVSGTQAFSVKSPSHDTVWYFYLGGTLQGHYNTNVTSGPVFAASERHLAGENLSANFSKLRWFGASGSWNAWTELTGVRDTQPPDSTGYSGDNVTDYSFCMTSGVTDAFTVKTTC